MKLSIPLFIASIFHDVHAIGVFDSDGTQVYSTKGFDWSIKPKTTDMLNNPNYNLRNVDIDWDHFLETKMIKSYDDGELLT